MNYNSNLTPNEQRDLASVGRELSAEIRKCKEPQSPTEGSVREVVTQMEGEAKEAESPIDSDVAEVVSEQRGEVREVSESAEGKVQKVEASTKDEMKLCLDDSELPTTIDELNKFIADKKRKELNLRKNIVWQFNVNVSKS